MPTSSFLMCSLLVLCRLDVQCDVNTGSFDIETRSRYYVWMGRVWVAYIFRNPICVEAGEGASRWL